MTNRVHDEGLRRQYLGAMGVQLWERRQLPDGSDEETEMETVAADVVPVSNNPDNQVLVDSDIAGLDWESLASRVAECTACALHETRTQAVFGVGDRNAQWMVIGEAPGADEDRQGEPFVGRAGQLLNAMLEAIGLKREQVYIANIVKCRPPNNRNPLAEEASQCESYLKRQIVLINPKVILAVGKVAAHNLLKTDSSVGAMRGRRYTYADTGIPVVVTYHPAYLLRSPREKRKAWEDLQFAQKILSNKD